MITWVKRLFDFGNAPEPGLVLGRGRLYSEPKGRERLITLPRSLSNQHGLIWGRSGFGKTRFEYSPISKKILSNESVVVFDSHDLWLHLVDMIGETIDPERLGSRLCIIDPTSQEYGITGLNVLEVDEGVHPYEAVEELVSAFKSIWKESWGDRLADILRHSCWTLIEHNLTLLEMPRLLSDEVFRKQLVQKLKNEETKLFWQSHFAGLTKGDQRYVVESVRNKVSALVMNPYVRPVLGQQKSTVSFRSIMDHPDGGICFVHLSRNRLKSDQQRLFGALLFSKLYQSILAREDTPEAERRPVNIFIEEANEVWNPDSMLNILSGARKLGCRLWLSFQAISQLTPKDVDLILNGAAVNIIFNVEREEAKRLLGIFNFTGTHIKHEEYDIFGPKGKPSFYSVQEEQENAIKELTTQRVRECYIRMLGDESDEPYIAEAFDVQYPIENQETRRQLREQSATHYARPQQEVWGEIDGRSLGQERAGGYNGDEDAGPQQPHDLSSLFAPDEEQPQSSVPLKKKPATKRQAKPKS